MLRPNMVLNFNSSVPLKLTAHFEASVCKTVFLTLPAFLSSYLELKNLVYTLSTGWKRQISKSGRERER